MSASGVTLVGALIDRRYRVEAPIARGGMSTVYRGMDTRLDRPVAIKIMDPQYAADPAFVQRFAFEARAVARLNSSGLVSVYDHGSDGDLAFLVMELVVGGTLRELLRERGPMPAHAAGAVMQPVLDALAVAHRAGLVHRDIKPENVLISEDGAVKIADFGLVRALAATAVTSNSVILGTAAYLSPEQVTDGRGDARSDVYSAGILLFETLTGTTPFTGDTSLSIAYQRIDHDVPPPSSRIDGVPPQFDALVRAATSRDPARRFPNAAAMAAALADVSAELDLPRYRVPAPAGPIEHTVAPTLAAPRMEPAAPTDHSPPTDHSSRTDHSSSTAQMPPRPAIPVGPNPTRVVTVATEREQAPVDDSPVAAMPMSRTGYRFPDFEADRRRSRRTVLIWLLVIVTLAALLGVSGWWLGSGRYGTVPDTTGMDRAAAVRAVESAGLTALERGDYSDTAAVDTPLGTDPPAGAQVPQGGDVTVVYSLGRPTVPAVVPGTPAADAENALRQRTLVPGRAPDEFSAGVAAGTVVRVVRGRVTGVGVGSRVDLVISKGAPPVQVPSVLGRSEADARAALGKVGLTVAAADVVFDSTVDAGNVISTDPPVGTTLPAGTAVTIRVSNAVAVPIVLARTVESARATLGGLGLQVLVQQVSSSGRALVINQNPGPGQRVEPGSTVTITALP